MKRFLIILLSLAILGGAGYFGWKAWAQNNQQTNNNNNQQPNEEKRKIPDGFTEYRNEELGFRFAYPKEWGDVQLKKIENSNQFKITFTKSSAHSGLYEYGDGLYEGTYGMGPKYSAFELRIKNLERGIENPTTFSDGSSERWERITITERGSLYAYCVYALGLEAVGKIGDGSKSLFIEENIDGGAYPNLSTCTKSPESLKDLVTQTRINKFEDLLGTIEAI